MAKGAPKPKLHCPLLLQAVTQALQPTGAAFQLHPVWKSLPSPWLKAWPQLFNISMKPVKTYRYVKWPWLRLVAKLAVQNNSQWPFYVCPIPQFRLVGGEDILYFQYFLDTLSSGPYHKSLFGAPHMTAPCTLGDVKSVGKHFYWHLYITKQITHWQKTEWEM